jgi:hypothetical protein
MASSSIQMQKMEDDARIIALNAQYDEMLDNYKKLFTQEETDEIKQKKAELYKQINDIADELDRNERRKRRPSTTMQKIIKVGDKPVLPGIGYVKNFMNEEYSDEAFKLSTSVDILVVYLKAQKILYTESKVYCEHQLNMLMLPAITISSLCTLLSLALQGFTVGAYVVSGLAAINSFILAVVSYLKLDAKAEAHKTTAYQYNKLLNNCEFNSYKLMLFTKDNKKNNQQLDLEAGKPENYEDKLKEIIENVEKKIDEIQDTNKFMLPQYIRYNFRTLNETNLFSKVKKLQLDELQYMNELKVEVRKVHEKQLYFADEKYNFDFEKFSRTPDDNQEKVDFNKRVEEKEKIMKKIIAHRDEYLKLENEIKEEIDKFIEKSKKGFWKCNWLKS